MLEIREDAYIFRGRDSAICMLHMKGIFIYKYFFSLSLMLGPPLPKVLAEHSMVEINGDAYIFGGESYYGDWNSAIYRLSCSSGICSWSTINQELKVARSYTVAIPVPDTFCV